MRWRNRGLAALVAVLGACTLGATPASGDAVTYQADAMHSGFVPGGPNPPLGRKWIRRDLGLQVSYPVIAEGKVFVTAYAPASSSSSSSIGPTYLHALDRDSGRTLWVRQVARGGLPAYGDGRVYVGGAEALDAVSAATGERIWRADLDSGGGIAPVADGAFVYASDSDGAHAISADTGLTLQTEPLAQAAFTVVGERVYLTRGGCETIAAYTRGLAQQIWSRSGPCRSSASVPAAYHTLNTTPPNERIWARDSNGTRGLVVDALTSLGTEEFVSEGGLALAGEHAYLRGANNVQARSQSSGVIAWSASPGQQLGGSALAVRDAVWVTTAQGALVALRRSDGGEMFRTQLTTQQPDGQLYDGTTPSAHLGMAADERGLLVPYESRLVALGPGGDAPGIDDPDKIPGGTTTLTASMKPADYEFGKSVRVEGQVTDGDGSRLGGHEVELQADPYPYGVWEAAARANSDQYSGFSLTHRPDRNTRYRVVDTSTAPAVESKTFQAWVFPKVRLRLGYRGTGRVYVASTMSVPDYLNLNGKPLYVYRLRSRNAVGTRIGSIKIKRAKGNNYVAKRTLRVPSHRPRTDYFFICFKLPDTRQLTRLNGRKFGCGRSRF